MYAEERDQLVTELTTLTNAQWATASLCRGWDVHATTAHLLMPYPIGEGS